MTTPRLQILYYALIAVLLLSSVYGSDDGDKDQDDLRNGATSGDHHIEEDVEHEEFIGFRGDNPNQCITQKEEDDCNCKIVGQYTSDKGTTTLKKSATDTYEHAQEREEDTLVNIGINVTAGTRYLKNGVVTISLQISKADIDATKGFRENEPFTYNPGCAGGICPITRYFGSNTGGSHCTQAAYTYLNNLNCPRGDGRGYDCGHIVACRMGGEGAMGNVFCQSTPINRGTQGMYVGSYRQLEDYIVNCVVYLGAGWADMSWTFTPGILPGTTNWATPSRYSLTVNFQNPNVCPGATRAWNQNF